MNEVSLFMRHSIAWNKSCNGEGVVAELVQSEHYSITSQGAVVGQIQEVGNFRASDVVRLSHPTRGVLELPFVRSYFDMNFKADDPFLRLLLNLEIFDESWSPLRANGPSSACIRLSAKPIPASAFFVQPPKKVCVLKPSSCASTLSTSMAPSMTRRLVAAMGWSSDPLVAALDALPAGARVIYTSPTGRLWGQKDAEFYASLDQDLIFIAGRFAGIDQRFVDRYVHDEVSIGDFVVSGGELPCLLMADSILRQIPGVLGNARSAQDDSFASGMNGLLEYPLYTRPPVFEGQSVPEVLMSEDHQHIGEWRRAAALEKARRLRPDLFEAKNQRR